jgi:hypothetical protein
VTHFKVVEGILNSCLSLYAQSVLIVFPQFVLIVLRPIRVYRIILNSSLSLYPQFVLIALPSIRADPLSLSVSLSLYAQFAVLASPSVDPSRFTLNSSLSFYSQLGLIVLPQFVLLSSRSIRLYRFPSIPGYRFTLNSG